jgi:ApaG protein
MSLAGPGDAYHFAYFVRIENHSAEPVMLLARHWDINDLHGTVQTVRGLGVVGQMPTLDIGDSYEYRSQCVLAAPLGVMRGFYRMLQVQQGAELTVEIKPFGLIASTLQQEPAGEDTPADASSDPQAPGNGAKRFRKRPARPPL